jgi:hypothetical protein
MMTILKLKFEIMLQVKAGMFNIDINDYQTRAIQSAILNPGFKPGFTL